MDVLIPRPDAFSFYHDTFDVSTSPLKSPWTTLPAIVGLLALLILAFLFRRQRPLFSLGVAWFLVAHSITATVIPLELVFEHRNYLASAGLLLAVAGFVVPNRTRTSLTFARTALIAAFFFLSAFTLSFCAPRNGATHFRSRSQRHQDTPTRPAPPTNMLEPWSSSVTIDPIHRICPWRSRHLP